MRKKTESRQLKSLQIQHKMKEVEFYDASSNKPRTVTIQTNVRLIHDQGPLHQTLKYLTLDLLERHCA